MKASLDLPLSDVNIFDFKNILKDSAIPVPGKPTQSFNYASAVQKSQILPDWTVEKDISGFTREMGVKMAATIRKYNEIVTADKGKALDDKVLTSNDQSTFEKWRENAQKGAEYIKFSREKDIDETKMHGNPKSKPEQYSLETELKRVLSTSILGTETKSKTIELPGRTSSQTLGPWTAPNEHATILANPGLTDVSPKYQEALGKWNGHRSAKAHRVLIEAFDEVIGHLERARTCT